MEIVIDSNVLFRILISRGEIINLLFNRKLKIFAPLKLKEEFVKHRQDILLKSKLPKEKFDEFSRLVFKRITFVPLEKYESFIPKAKQLLDKHEKDEDFIALCLLKNTKLWAYEQLLFNIGFAISTKQISEKLSTSSEE